MINDELTKAINREVIGDTYGPSGYEYGTDWRECKGRICCRLNSGKACACNGNAFNGTPFGDRWDLLSEITLAKRLKVTE